MITRPTSYLFFAAASLIAGCEQVVDLGGGGASQIIIDSQLKVGEPVEVRLAVINSFGAPARAPDLVDATGVIGGSDGSARPLRVVSFDTARALLTVDSLTVTEGITYTLDLDAPGFAPITSITTVPQSAKLARLPTAEGERTPERDSSLIGVPFVFDDIPGADNFFYLLVRIAEGGDGGRERLEGGILRNRETITVSEDGTWLFDDRAFADGTYVGRVEFDPALLSDYEQPVAVLELRTVSRAYYAYLRSALARERQLVGNPHREAVTDNVIGAGGLFGSYSVSVVTQALN